VSAILSTLCVITLLQSEPTSAPAAGPRVRIATVDGRSTECTLREIDPRRGLIYDADQSDLILPRDDVVQLSVIAQSDVPSSNSPDEQLIYLEGGGVLHATILPDDGEGGGKIRFRCAIGHTMIAPFGSLRAVRLATKPTAVAEQELAARLADRKPGRDLLLIMKEGKPVVLPGTLESIDADQWSFRFGTRLQKSALNTAYAVILGGAPLHQANRDTFNLIDGDVLTGGVVSASGSHVEVDVGQAGRWSVPWTVVRTIDLANPRIVYLSELTPAAVESRFFLDAEWKPRCDRSVSGGPIRIAGESYSRGLGVHATTSLRYRLEGKFERFCANAGVDDEVARHGSVIFRVRGDDRILVETPILKGGDKAVAISVDVSGVDTLILDADAGEDLDLSDHADWAQARLIRARRSAIR
jgi:hypothetical protein